MASYCQEYIVQKYSSEIVQISQISEEKPFDFWYELCYSEKKIRRIKPCFPMFYLIWTEHLPIRNRVLPNVCSMPFAVWESKSRIWTSLSLLSDRPLLTVSGSFMGWIRNRRLKRWQSTGNVFRKKVYMRMRFIPE